MVKIPKIHWPHILSAFMLYAAVLIYQGYQYGQGDQSQILPVLYAQDHPDSYSQDHYVTQYLKSNLNERTVFHFLFRYLGYDQVWIVLIWHAGLSIALILAWLRIAALGLKKPGYQYLSIALILLAGFHTSTGSNEIYYNSVIPSLAAKCLASWALYHWLRENYSLWAVLLIIAVLIQPLVGVQMFLLTGISLLIFLLIKGRALYFPWRQTLIYLAITIPWIYLLRRYNGASEDPKLYMDIIEFRLSHHFFIKDFGWGNVLLALLFLILTIRYSRARVKWFMILLAAGCVIYTIGVEYYHSPFILYTQWWKTTIWLEAFACIVIIAIVEKYFPSTKLISKYSLLVPLIIIGLVGFYRLSGYFGSKPDYMFPWSSYKSEAVDISEQASQLTDKNAVFIIPIDFSAFRWYSKRSTYVDYKALFHQEDFLIDWYQRIQNIYAYSLAEKKGGFDIKIFSRSLLNEPSGISIDYWKSLGITHIISESPGIKTLQLIGKNEKYFIYKL